MMRNIKWFCRKTGYTEFPSHTPKVIRDWMEGAFGVAGIIGVTGFVRTTNKEEEKKRGAKTSGTVPHGPTGIWRRLDVPLGRLVLPSFLSFPTGSGRRVRASSITQTGIVPSSFSRSFVVVFMSGVILGLLPSRCLSLRLVLYQSWRTGLSLRCVGRGIAS